MTYFYMPLWVLRQGELLEEQPSSYTTKVPFQSAFVETNSIEGQYCRKGLVMGLREAWQETGLKHLDPHLGRYLYSI